MLCLRQDADELAVRSIMKKLFKWKKKKAPVTEYYWEWFNRTFVVTNKIKQLQLKNYRVLDVGGTKRENLLKKMGIENVVSANIIDDADVRASGYDLPFKDRSFECVTCVAMLEHVPQELRGKIARELIRVASKAVFVSAPIASEENDRAEEIVLKYLAAGFVKEHRVFGLVDFDRLIPEIRSSVSMGKVSRIQEDDIDNLLNWVVMMVGNKVDVSQLYQELYFLENKFNPRTKVLSIYLK